MTIRDRITEVTAGAVREEATPVVVIPAVGIPAEAAAVVAGPVGKAMKTGRKCMN
jgi:hypothetical protein